MVVRQDDFHDCSSRVLQKGKWSYQKILLLIFHDFQVNIYSKLTLSQIGVNCDHVIPYE